MITNSGEVVRRAQAGDMAAFEILYREHSPRVFALCLRLSGGGQSEASELMQDVFGEAGRHARSAVGVPVLPLGAAVEIDAVVAIKAG